jgi:glycosyltransferase involved in cell wall biosynthesis
LVQLTALMSVYNGEKHIKETIDSVLNQSFTDFEFIVVDDGSNDGTVDILKSYKDNRMKVFFLEKNVGIPKALNFGIDKSIGDYVVKIDADDVQHPERFEKQLSFMLTTPKMALSKTLCEYFPDTLEIEKSQRYKTFKKYIEPYKNSTLNEEQIAERLKWFCCISHTTMMIKLEVLKKYRYRNLPLFEDYDLFYRLNEDKLLMGSLNEFLVKIRVSLNSTTVRKKYTLDECAFLIKEKQLNQFKNNQSIYIWGSGEFGKSVYEVLVKRGWHLRGYIDSNPELQGKLIDGMEVYSPDIIDNKKINKVIVASQPGMFQIIDYLQQFDYQSEVDFMVYR